MNTRVLLIRHGATVLSAEDRFAGATDVELSEEGRRQATCLGDRLRTMSIAAIYTSPMKRTRETSRLAGAAHPLEPVAEPALREIDHGRWEGLTRSEVELRFPEEYAAWIADPYSFAPQSGEAGSQVLARARPALDAIVTRHPGETVAIVSHKATIRLLISDLLGIAPTTYRERLEVSPACLNIVETKGGPFGRLFLFNDTSHYETRPV